MKKTFLSFLVLFSLSIYAETITPVKHRTIKGDQTVYTSDQVDSLLLDAGKVKKIVAGQNITVSPATGEGEVTINATGGAAQKNIAMFIIPMNDTASTTKSSAYTQFELKASYNNFDPSKSGVQRCCYYVHSGHADEFGVSDNDKARMYINHGGSDQRSYVKVANTITDPLIASYAPNAYIVIVDASQCWPTRSDGSWLNSEDGNLIWTYVRTKNDQREVDPGTENCLWRPIAPVKWMSSLPSWAN